MKLYNYLLSPFTDLNKKRSTHGDSLYVLDGLRGLAVLIVLMSHSAAFGMHGQGSLGVLLFFFLSGFVLTLPYAETPGNLLNKNELFRFASNRFLRIVPVYLVAVAAITIASDSGLGWFLYNASFIKGWNHLWSVAEEVRFYLLFPFVIALLALLPGHILRMLILVILIYYSYRYRDVHKIDLMDGRFVGFYFWMFLGGSLTCMLYSWPVIQKFRNNTTLKHIASLAAILVLLFIFLSSNHLISTLWKPLFSDLPNNFHLNGWSMPGMWFGLFLVLLLSVTLFNNSVPGKFLQSPLLRHIGLLSYSLYLFHMYILLSLQRMGFKYEGLFVAVFLLSWLIALFTYLCIEKPFLMLKPKRATS